MRNPRIVAASHNNSPYAWRHPQVLRWSTAVVLGVIILVPTLMMVAANPYESQNRMHSRVFHLSPHLHNSRPHTKSLNLTGYHVILDKPVDNRRANYGKQLAKGKTVEPVNELFTSTHDIQNKILDDMKYFGANPLSGCSQRQLGIRTTVNIFYPYVKGYGWSTGFAKVALQMEATLNDSVVLSRSYEADYSSSGLGKGYEGSVITTIEQGANVAMGMTFRKALDGFYSDLSKTLPENKTITLEGSVIDAISGDTLVATIAVKSDKKQITNTATQNGRFSVSLPNNKEKYEISIHTVGYQELSTTFSPSAFCYDEGDKVYKLNPMRTLNSVLFAVGNDNWLSGSTSKLDRVVAFMENNPHIKIELHGYTDIAGDLGKDKALSKARVRAVKSYLVNHGIARRRIMTQAHGASQPVSQGNHEESRMLNRRVEFVVVEL